MAKGTLLRLIQMCLFVLVASSGSSAQPPVQKNDKGLWLSEDHRYVIAVSLCHSTLCGKIYWIDPDVAPFDVENPDPEKRGMSLCGLNVLLNFKKIDDKNWTGGTVYRPKTGKKYHATIKILPSGKALLRGYILLPFFGQSEILTLVSAKDYPQCRARNQ